jgi:DNA-binding CsgD family transcriptional regulator
MVRSKKPERHHQLPHGPSLHAKLFVFFDKITGARRFEIKADQNGDIPFDEAVSLLAVHCMARHQVPGDFGILVGTGEDLIHSLVRPATRLIESCSSVPVANSQARLSRRQYEVLNGIRQKLSNKEIASRLNLAERTVKFHVSTLFEKLHVRRRVDLLLEPEGYLPLMDHKRGAKPRARLKEEGGMAVALLRPAEIVRTAIPMEIRSGR